MENSEKKTIKSFHDLRVYQNLYKSMVLVLTKVVPKLPNEEKYDLADQMRRACKAAPSLISEGFAKRYQKRQWQKYIDDTIGECNEIIHHLSVCEDVYPRFVDVNLCKELIDDYDVSCKQLTTLRKVWKDFHAGR
ncbi:four helix bundle protein [candidate division TA06 bacterium]|nr:four helix bundle protein [candidate division TA06 bacterium]